MDTTPLSAPLPNVPIEAGVDPEEADEDTVTAAPEVAQMVVSAAAAAAMEVATTLQEDKGPGTPEVVEEDTEEDTEDTTRQK